jgi:hypothetical protein
MTDVSVSGLRYLQDACDRGLESLDISALIR